jgi:kynurenine formamidase
LWLHEREVSVYSGDCIEALPSNEPGLDMPLHQLGAAAMGLAILDNPDIEGLADACSRHGRHDFALVIAPLKIQGGTGCAVNPLALF